MNASKEDVSSFKSVLNLIKKAASKGRFAPIQKMVKGQANAVQLLGAAVVYAVKRGHLKLIHELLKEGAVISWEDWRAALRSAIENERLDIVRELTENAPRIHHSKKWQE